MFCFNYHISTTQRETSYPKPRPVVTQRFAIGQLSHVARTLPATVGSRWLQQRQR